MQVLVAMLIGGLISAVSHIVGRVLLALGLGYASYRGVNVLLTWVKDQVFTSLGTMGADVVQLLGVLQIGTCVNILASAYVVRLTLSGLTSDTLKSFVLGAATKAI